jgi:hypothetical protein
VTAFVRAATDLRLQLASRPGSMASLFAAFDAAGITVHGVCAIGEDDMDADHFLVDDADAAVAAAANAGAVEVRRREVLLVAAASQGVTTTEVLQRIAAAGAGIDLMYLAATGALVLGAIPLEDARAALTAMARERGLGG